PTETLWSFENAANTCASKTAVPTWPGIGPPLYKPTLLVEPFGTAIAPPAVRPTLTIGLLRPIEGMTRRGPEEVVVVGFAGGVTFFGATVPVRDPEAELPCAGCVCCAAGAAVVATVVRFAEGSVVCASASDDSGLGE